MQWAGLDAPERRHILHVAYYDSLLKTRTTMLERSGYRVSSALGNGNAKLLAGELSATVDLVVIGFSASHQMRAEMLGWCKRHFSQVPVMVLQAHNAEQFPEADCIAMSEDPQTWLAAVADCVNGV